jgi:NAD(P)-dependent dehydrogenase (short-subunit alcohol dehydrogenase family)
MSIRCGCGALSAVRRRLGLGIPATYNIDVDLGIAERVAWVTGSAYGIGRAIALQLASEGAKVAVHYRSSADDARETLRDVQAAGSKGCLVSCDLTDVAATTEAHRNIEETLGPIDILINNAGEGASSRFETSSWTDWEPQLLSFVLGTMQASRLVVSGMQSRRWGRVITIVGDSGRVGESRLVATSAARAGQIGFTKALAKELGRDNITANAIALGLIPTKGSERYMGPAALAKNLDRITSLYPMRRLGSPEDVAPLVAFLASPLAGYITGQTISVSGGYTTA